MPSRYSWDRFVADFLVGVVGLGAAALILSIMALPVLTCVWLLRELF